MKSIFKLSLITIAYEKLVFLVLILGGVLPFGMAEMTNYEVSDVVLEPARAQVAWQFAWLASMFWLLFQAAKLGGEHSRSGLGAYFYSQKIKNGSQLTALSASVAIVALLIGGVAVLVVLFGAMPENGLEAKHWGLLTVQHFVFYTLVVGSLLMFAIALASRFGVTVGYVFSVGFALVGFYGVKMLGKLVVSKDFMPLDLLYVSLPHYYLGDLTHRFVHKQGALSSSEFFSVFEYLSGWAILLAVISGVTYSSKQK